MAKTGGIDGMTNDPMERIGECRAKIWPYLNEKKWWKTASSEL
jgi:hypothetical protein